MRCEAVRVREAMMVLSVGFGTANSAAGARGRALGFGFIVKTCCFIV